MSDEETLSLFGITRFSMVTNRTLGSFRLTREKSINEAKSIIWEQERLRKRLWFFRNFCLPSYKMMSEQSENSHGAIILNEDIPILNEIIELCRDVPRLDVIALNDDDNHRLKAKNHIKDVLGGGRRTFNYRYDDDDALSVNFLPLASSYARSQEDGACISFNIGYSLSRISSDKFGLKTRRYPMIGLGLGVLSNTNNLTTIFEMGHHRKIKNPTYHDTNTIGWLTPLHDGNDSHVGAYSGPIFPLNKVKQQISSDFPTLDFEALSDLPIRREPDQR